MDLMIAMPNAANTPVKPNSRGSTDKTAASVFGNVLELAYQNTAADKDIMQPVNNVIPDLLMPAMLGMFQPAVTPLPMPYAATETATAQFIDLPKQNAPNLNQADSTGVIAAALLTDGKQPRQDTQQQAFATNTSQDAAAFPAPQAFLSGDTVAVPSIVPSVDTPLFNAVAAKLTDLPDKAPAVLQANQNQNTDLLRHLSKHTPNQPIFSQQQQTPEQIPVAATAPIFPENKPTEQTYNDPKPVAMSLQGMISTKAEEGQFKGFSHQGHSDQTNTADISLPKTDGQPVIFPFNTTLERHIGVKQADTAENQPTQQQQSTFPDKYDVATQIVEHARLISRPQNTEMIIRLKPEHLGELTFKVAVEQGVLNATFHSNNAEVRSIIEASLPQLKQELTSQGIKLDNVGVFAGMDQFLANDQRGGQQYQQTKIHVSKKTEAEFAETVVEVSTAVNTGTNTGGVDYRI